MPHDAKNAMPDNKRPEKLMLMQTTEGYRSDLALRVFECLSQLPTFKMVFGVGDDGKKVCNAWRKEIRAWHKSRLKENAASIRDFNIAKLWVKYRAKNGSKRYQPIKFISGRKKPAGIVHPVRTLGPRKIKPKGLD